MSTVGRQDELRLLRLTLTMITGSVARLETIEFSSCSMTIALSDSSRETCVTVLRLKEKESWLMSSLRPTSFVSETVSPLLSLAPVSLNSTSHIRINREPYQICSLEDTTLVLVPSASMSMSLVDVPTKATWTRQRFWTLKTNRHGLGASSSSRQTSLQSGSAPQLSHLTHTKSPLWVDGRLAPTNSAPTACKWRQALNDNLNVDCVDILRIRTTNLVLKLTASTTSSFSTKERVSWKWSHEMTHSSAQVRRTSPTWSTLAASLLLLQRHGR